MVCECIPIKIILKEIEDGWEGLNNSKMPSVQCKIVAQQC